MIKHIVMWNLKETFDEAEKTTVCKELKEKLEGLNAQIPEIQSIEVGFDLNGSENSMDVLLYSTFDSVSDLETYQSHPAHVKVAKFVGSVVSERKVVDYEI